MTNRITFTFFSNGNPKPHPALAKMGCSELLLIYLLSDTSDKDGRKPTVTIKWNGPMCPWLTINDGVWDVFDTHPEFFKLLAKLGREETKSVAKMDPEDESSIKSSISPDDMRQALLLIGAEEYRIDTSCYDAEHGYGEAERVRGAVDPGVTEDRTHPPEGLERASRRPRTP